MFYRLFLLAAGFFALLTSTLPAESTPESDIKWIIWNDTARPENFQFSPDGNLFYGITSRPYEGVKVIYQYYIYEASTGKLLHSFQDLRQSLGFLTDTTLSFLSFASKYVDGTQVYEYHLHEVGFDGKDIRLPDTIPYSYSTLILRPDFVIYKPAYEGPWHVRDYLTGDTFQFSFDLFPNYPVLLMNDRHRVFHTSFSQDDKITHFVIRNIFTSQTEWDKPVTVDVLIYAHLSNNNRFVVYLNNHVINVYHFETGSLTRQIVSGLLKGYPTPIADMELTLDDNYVIVPIDDGTIRIWDLWTGQEVYSFTEYQGQHTDLVLSPDRRHMLSVTTDGAVIMWKLPAVTTGVAEDAVKDKSSLQCRGSFSAASNAVTFSFDLPQQSRVGIDIYDVQGNRVGSVAEEPMDAGSGRLVWDAGTSAQGCYFYRLRAGGQSATGYVVVR